MESNVNAVHREPWNKGKIVGQKAPFKVRDIWALRVRLQIGQRHLASSPRPVLVTPEFAEIHVSYGVKYLTFMKT